MRKFTRLILSTIVLTFLAFYMQIFSFLDESNFWVSSIVIALKYILILACSSWILIEIVIILKNRLLKRFDINFEDNLKSRKLHTQINLLEKVIVFVIILDIGTRDLHHCADAAIYLRANYNYSNGFIDRLKFTFTNGYVTTYEEYLKGANATPVNAGRDIITKWGKNRKDNCKTFRRWLDLVWNYAGTYSIEKYDTIGVNYWDMQPGDVFVTGGFPGHAITVVDMAINKAGHKIFMLAQSYMPAQEQHILLNPVTLDVWYSMDDMNYINTPEFVFEPSDLRRFIL